MQRKADIFFSPWHDINSSTSGLDADHPYSRQKDANTQGNQAKVEWPDERELIKVDQAVDD